MKVNDNIIYREKLKVLLECGHISECTYCLMQCVNWNIWNFKVCISI